MLTSIDRIARVAAGGLLALAVTAGAALAQTFDPQRDCQTLLSCNYAKGGSFRGCVSSYSCRVCRLVPGRCADTAGRSVCQRMQCRWG